MPTQIIFKNRPRSNREKAAKAIAVSTQVKTLQVGFCAVFSFFELTKDFLSRFRNCSLAFSLAERELGIPALLDPQDMAECDTPDRLSILTYVSEFYHRFKEATPQPCPRSTVLKRKESTDSGIVSSLSRTTSSVSSASMSPSASSSSSVCDSPPPSKDPEDEAKEVGGGGGGSNVSELKDGDVKTPAGDGGPDAEKSRGGGGDIVVELDPSPAAAGVGGGQRGHEKRPGEAKAEGGAGTPVRRRRAALDGDALVPRRLVKSMYADRPEEEAAGGGGGVQFGDGESPFKAALRKFSSLSTQSSGDIAGQAKKMSSTFSSSSSSSSSTTSSASTTPVKTSERSRQKSLGEAPSTAPSSSAGQAPAPKVDCKTTQTDESHLSLLVSKRKADPAPPKVVQQAAAPRSVGTASITYLPTLRSMEQPPPAADHHHHHISSSSSHQSLPVQVSCSSHQQQQQQQPLSVRPASQIAEARQSHQQQHVLYDAKPPPQGYSVQQQLQLPGGYRHRSPSPAGGGGGQPPSLSSCPRPYQHAYPPAGPLRRTYSGSLSAPHRGMSVARADYAQRQPPPQAAAGWATPPPPPAGVVGWASPPQQQHPHHHLHPQSPVRGHHPRPAGGLGQAPDYRPSPLISESYKSSLAATPLARRERNLVGLYSPDKFSIHIQGQSSLV